MQLSNSRPNKISVLADQLFDAHKIPCIEAPVEIEAIQTFEAMTALVDPRISTLFQMLPLNSHGLVCYDHAKMINLQGPRLIDKLFLSLYHHRYSVECPMQNFSTLTVLLPGGILTALISGPRESL